MDLPLSADRLVLRLFTSTMSIQDLHALFLQSDGISTDTRKIEPNTLFFALKGANFNGNSFAQQALKSGASHAVIDEEEYHLKDKTIFKSF